MHNGTICLSQVACDECTFTSMATYATAEDWCLIKCLRVDKGWNAFQVTREFSVRTWKNVL